MKTPRGEATMLRTQTTRFPYRLLDALIRIDLLFRYGACVPMERLASEIGASPRTIQRYLARMRALVGPIEFDSKRGGYRYSRGATVVPALALSDDELIALYVAQPVLRQYRGTPFEPRLRMAFDKLTRYLPEATKQVIASMPGVVEARDLGLTPDPGAAGRFDTLVRAAMSRHTVRMRYYSIHQDIERDREMDPYGLMLVGDEWYMAGFCHVHHEVRTFIPSQVRAVHDTGVTFVRPAGFDIREYFASSLGVFRDPPTGGGEPVPVEVRLRVDGFAARYLRERPRHRTQRMVLRRDGWFDVSWTVTGMPEVERFVLGWGEHVEVLGPASLRASVAARIRAASGLYANSR